MFNSHNCIQSIDFSTLISGTVNKTLRLKGQNMPGNLQFYKPDF